jgi:translation initiation factor 2 beta subunit (eIF-2beta)/eIF-5
METILNLCANREIEYKDHAKRTYVPMSGHHGEQTKKMAIGKRFYWPEMKEDVEHFVHTYVKCQNTKSISKKKYGLYRPLLILYEPR